jgi:hypothetical protein
MRPDHPAVFKVLKGRFGCSVAALCLGGGFPPEQLTRTSCTTMFVSVKNVTIVLDERVADWARIEAARRRTSVSCMVGEMLAEKMQQERSYEKAMNQFLNLKPLRLRQSPHDKLPTRNEVYQDAGRLRG